MSDFNGLRWPIPCNSVSQGVHMRQPKVGDTIISLIDGDMRIGQSGVIEKIDGLGDLWVSAQSRIHGTLTKILFRASNQGKSWRFAEYADQAFNKLDAQMRQSVNKTFRRQRDGNMSQCGADCEASLGDKCTRCQLPYDRALDVQSGFVGSENLPYDSDW